MKTTLAATQRHLGLGRAAETATQQYLIQHGLLFLRANFLCRLGEIDLIMREAKTLVFVEVRCRKQYSTIDAIESISPKKQARLLRTAVYYLQKTAQNDALCRFDVVGVTSTLHGFQFEWIKNALTLGD